MIKHVILEPGHFFKQEFQKTTDAKVLGRFSQEKPDLEVQTVSGLDCVVRINSTYVELVDRLYYGRGSGTLYACAAFGLFFIGCFLWPLCRAILRGGVKPEAWIIVGIVWIVIILPICWISSKFLFSEVFKKTYYPIRFNRKNKMIYVYQASGEVRAVPWRDPVFVLGANLGKPTSWSIFGCLVGEDGETVTEIIPLPASLNWSQESLGIFWEFIRCYMEDEECLEDLVQTISWCPPVEKDREGWLFGLLYICKLNTRLGLLVNLPIFPLAFLISLVRWVVMKTSKVPVWPQDVVDACRVEADDPISLGAEDNPPQYWRQMLAVQGKVRYARTYAKERGAMERIVAHLKEKYGAGTSTSGETNARMALDAELHRLRNHKR